MKKRIIFATGNEGKMREVRMILADLDYEIVSMKEAGIDVEVVEDGKTFEENALIKANAIAKETGELVLADDSGLEIDYFDKAPGVYSARYLGEDTPYEIKNKIILERMEGVPKEQRTARFVCVIAAVFPDGTEKNSSEHDRRNDRIRDQGRKRIWIRSDLLSAGIWLYICRDIAGRKE